MFKEGEIYLFGSYADDDKKGGDIVFNLDDTRLIEKEAKRWGIKL